MSIGERFRSVHPRELSRSHQWSIMALVGSPVLWYLYDMAGVPRKFTNEADRGRMSMIQGANSIALLRIVGVNDSRLAPRLQL